MQDHEDRGQPKERPERHFPRHKTKEKIGVDEGFVKDVGEENVSPSPHPRPPRATADEPSRMRSARERRKALIRKRKIRD
jgi:hypothetical protein